jgi:hypothetical protein
VTGKTIWARVPPRHDVARTRAPRAGRPRHLHHAPPKAACRPRPALPQALRPEAVGILPVRAAGRRSVGGAPPYTRRSRPGTTTTSSVPLPSPRSRAAPINAACSPLLPRHCHSTAPSAPPPSSCTPPCLPRSSNHPCPFPRPYRTVTCHLLSRPSPCRCRSRAAAAAAAGPRRAPTPSRSPPQLRSPPGPSEHTVVPRRFPDRERSRLAGIRPAPPPPHGQGPDCKPPISSRVFCAI